MKMVCGNVENKKERCLNATEQSVVSTTGLISLLEGLAKLILR